MSPRTRQVKKTPNETAKERILRVATELFAAKGYHATGVQELTDAVGLGRGALYYHIQSKENLLYEISISRVQEMIGRAKELAALDAPSEVRLRELARDLLRNLAQDEAGFRVALYESRALSAEHRREVLKARRAYEKVWAGVMADGSEHGSWRLPGPLVQRGLPGLFTSTYLWIESQGRLSPETIADSYVELLLDGLRPR